MEPSCGTGMFEAESATTAEQPPTKASRADDALEAVDMAVRVSSVTGKWPSK